MARKREIVGIRLWVWAAAVFLCVLSVCFSLLPPNQPATLSPKNAPMTENQMKGVELSISQIKPDKSSIAFQGKVETYDTPQSPYEMTFPEINLLLAHPPFSESAIPQLIECLDHPSAVIRAEAAFRLGTYRQAALDAAPALKKVAREDEDDLVRSRAKDALFNIRVYDFGPQSM